MFTLKESNSCRDEAIAPELESIKKIYAGYSNVYDVLFKRLFQPRIKHAINEMNIMPGDRVLDVGVGTGLSLPLYSRSCRVVGIDLSYAMLTKAKDKIRRNSLKNTSVLNMNAMSLSFADDSFDKVLISHVVSVVPDPYKLISEVRRVAKKGSNVVIVNHFKSKNAVLKSVERIINPLCKKIGWHNDLCIDEFIGRSGLKVKKTYKLKKTDFWQIIQATNVK